MRTIWYLLSLAGITLWIGTGSIVASWMGVRWKRGGFYDRGSRGWGASLLKANGIRLTTTGLDRLDPDQPYVFASNHTSLVDIWALMAALPHGLRFVAKQEMLKLPVLGRAMRSAGHIFIDRKRLKSAFGAYDDAAAAIRSGISAAVFPEGTRSPDGTLLPFKRAPFVLAIAAGVPVVPVYIPDAWKILTPGSVRMRSGAVEVRFGDPIPTEGLTADDRGTLAERTRMAVEELRNPVDGPTGAR
ncbi:MAG: lysophospholipid acyltransferase family protein [Gemmatimonadales bacterium]